VAAVALGRALPGLRVEAFLTDPSGALAPGDPTRRYWIWVLAGAGLAVVAASLLAIRAVSRELRLARMKSDFVSNLSHELRTPLTSMKLFVETLQEGRVRDEKEAKECLDVVAQETDRLTSFVDRILTFSAFEKGRAVVDAKPCDPSEVARTAAEVFRRRAASAGARLSVDAPAGLPACHLDRDAIIQVLLNLFDNALKHGGLAGGSPDKAVKKDGDKEGATIRLTVRALDQGGTEMIVEDDGPGVPGKERELVFEEFYRGDDTLSRRTQGAGIGLALCRRIALAHGATIDVSRSESLGGAAFRLRLPGGRA
ncbi:MAG: sensor histidine kinase, partial [Planctomycetota bacterium]